MDSGASPMQRSSNAGMGGMGASSSMGGGSNPGGSRPSDTVIIRNLPNDITWQDLREGFAQCGDIKYAEMKERGTGLIRFNSEMDADRATSKFLTTV